MLTNEKKKVILTDIDDVVVAWSSGLPYFAQKYNLPLDHILEMIQEEKFISPAELFNCDAQLGAQLIEKYNQSDFIRYLAPYIDALKVINKLKSKFDFVAITALGGSIDARLNRQFNLNALFPDAFKEILICEHNESKEVLLQRAKDTYGDDIQYFVDDLAKHIDSAERVFGNSIRLYWMTRGVRDEKPVKPGYVQVKDWNELLLKEKNYDERESYYDQIKKAIDQMVRDNPVPVMPRRSWPYPDIPVTPPSIPPSPWRTTGPSDWEQWYKRNGPMDWERFMQTRDPLVPPYNITCKV